MQDLLTASVLDDTGVAQQFEPENRFIRFLDDDDTYLGDELSPRPCSATAR